MIKKRYKVGDKFVYTNPLHLVVGIITEVEYLDEGGGYIYFESIYASSHPSGRAYTDRFEVDSPMYKHSYILTEDEYRMMVL